VFHQGKIDAVVNVKDLFVQFVPRSPIIQACELEGRAVIEHSPESKEAAVFRELAKQVINNQSRVIPSPISDLGQLEQLYRQHEKGN
jgi:nitrogenase iron protein NifH